MDKWLRLQVSAPDIDAVARARALLQDPAFDFTNPNRIRAVVGMFANLNPAAFHNLDGSGYEFIGSQVLEIEAKNPQLGARLCNAFSAWKKYDPARQELMKKQLLRIRDSKGVSKDVFEIAKRSIEG